jgi:hypothetical protein
MPLQREGRIAMPKSIACRLLLPALCLAAFVHCAGPTGEAPAPGAEQQKLNSPAVITLSLGKVGVLSKASAIDLRKLVLTAVSGGTPADTVHDTSALSGNEAMTLKRVVKLKPLLSWTLRAKTLDQRDSVIHLGETRPFTAQPADTARVSLSLASRFVMYQAMFGNLPDSLSADQAGAAKVAIDLNRLVLKVDGEVRADTTLPAGQYFLGGQNVALAFDYVTPGAHTVALEAYGAMEKWSGLMFSGSSTFTSAAGQDGSQPVTLKWVGPGTGAATLTLILGHVGKVTVMGGFNPML